MNRTTPIFIAAAALALSVNASKAETLNLPDYGDDLPLKITILPVEGSTTKQILIEIEDPTTIDEAYYACTQSPQDGENVLEFLHQKIPHTTPEQSAAIEKFVYKTVFSSCGPQTPSNG